MSTSRAPVAASTSSTNVESCTALSSIGASPPNWSNGGPALGSLPYVNANTQYPLFASNGDIVCQLSVMLANKPWTSTTGCGCAGVGRHDQSLAPGGGVPGCNAAASTLALNVYGT